MSNSNQKTAALTDLINAIQGYFSFVLRQKKLIGALMLSAALLASRTAQKPSVIQFCGRGDALARAADHPESRSEFSNPAGSAGIAPSIAVSTGWAARP